MNNPIATIKLQDKGEMKFELFLDTPISTANFISLAESEFYNGLNFHKQGGNYTSRCKWFRDLRQNT